MKRIWVIAAALILIFCLWAGLILLVASGHWNPPGTWNFNETGTLGDSFGIVSAMMATAAAVFTFTTMENERSESRKRERAEQERDAQATLVQLLTLRNELIAGIEISVGKKLLSGHQAIEHMASSIADAVAKRSEEQSYTPIYNRWRNALGHYFRFTYHVVVFADGNFDYPKNYTNVRWLRSQLTNAEQTLIGVNCLYGEGRDQFKKLVEFHALLHNIHPEERKRLSFDVLFEPTAFDLAPRPSPPKSWQELLFERLKDTLRDELASLKKRAEGKV
ncbi:hypothetical protein CFHF_26295 [Caulobacter flavus]|uniref:Phage abortive infection protein n=1 Tax=Caulobacter flavus TaxID=1679497 RepID=A0A2N5CKN6_9CAUL|nr:putative phage abortive infection protein [Caulobacter flavus]AYV47912.1 hypothetical protein C1707_17520 [Caulobacter flavus]PLR06051.1 hypothetical protein CFHF_26295 [Caulobacter flavus]